MTQYDNHRELLKEILKRHNVEVKELAANLEISQASLDRYLNLRQNSTTLATWLAIVAALPDQARRDYLKELFGDDITTWNRRDLTNLAKRLIDRLTDAGGNDQDLVEAAFLNENQ